MFFLKNPRPWQVGIVLSIGVLAVSASAIFVRLAIAEVEESGVGFSLFLAASRLTLSSLLLFPTWRNFQGQTVHPKAYIYSILAGIALAFHFAAWITSVSYTSITAATTLVTTNPIWVVLLSWCWLREQPKSLTLGGIVIAIAGSVVITFSDPGMAATASHPLIGNSLALIGAVMFSIYLLWGREAQRYNLTTSHYIIVAYTTAALILLPFPFLLGIDYLGYPPTVYLWIVAMAIVPQLIGHTSFNWSVRWISPTLVTLAILFEPMGSSTLGWLIFQEVPGPVVLIGAIILLVGVAIAVIGERE